MQSFNINKNKYEKKRMNIENITCTQMKYREFPELLFATSAKGIAYADATHYIQNKGNADKHTVIDFSAQFAFWIKSVCDTYELKPDSLIIMNDRGHFLIDESLALALVAYVDPAFGIHILERMSDMLLDGIVLSDTCLALMVKDRLSEEQITKLLKHDEKTW